MAAMTQKQCEAKGWNWNPKTQTCTRPNIGNVHMTVIRGAGCDGSQTEDVPKKKLTRPLQDGLLRAVAKSHRKRAAK